MQYLDLTLPTAAENLAVDEALLEEAEAASSPVEILRLWESPSPLVVVGRSSHVATEVRVEACRAAGVSVLRRVSGGASIVAGPGCLMYALVLSYQRNPRLRLLSHAHRYVLDTLARALAALAPGVQCRGTSDLAIGDLKFSGNSVRCRRNHFLYHGTLLYDFPLESIERYLAMPPRMPDYRAARPHGVFVGNLPVKVDAIRRALIAAWGAHEPRSDWPAALTARLVAEKYSRPEWNMGGNYSPSVTPFHESVRKGEAGRPSLLARLGAVSLRHA
jgi:lipoate-protein ligase A